MVNKIRKQKPKFKEQKQEKNKISKYIKKRPKGQKTKKENTYVFEGFYDKLKQIDVKHSHSMEQSFIYDKLLEKSELNEEDSQLFKSNFIQLLRSEKANNKTIEFGRIYSELEKYCFSYPLLVHNKTNIIAKLLSILESKDSQSVIQTGIIDLFIALIKDFRQEIYKEFIEMIMPQVIQQLDIQNVNLVDKIFTLISFGIKYLSKFIKEDIKNFYSLYYEVIIHKNKFIRKFASQSLCYVLRKLEFNKELLSILLGPLMKLQEDDDKIDDENKLTKFEDKIKVERQSDFTQIVGLSEMLFEVLYGSSENMYSQSSTILKELFKFNKSDKQFILLQRLLLLKLFNEVDTERHQQLYDTLMNTLKYDENQDDLNILLLFFKDCIRLKYGKRLQNYGLIQIVQCFNKILQKKQQWAQQLSVMTQINLAETISYLYYYKYNQVQQLFSKSNVDFSVQKNIFNHYILLLSDDIKVYQTYFHLLLSKPSQISCESDINYGQFLGLKPTAGNIEFSKDSHSQKIKLLLKSINKFVLKKISDKNHSIQYMGLLINIISQQHDHITIELSEQIEDIIISIHQNMKDKNSVENFILFKFISYCKNNNTKLHKYLSELKYSPNKNDKTLNLDLDSNFILKNYNISKEKKREVEFAFADIIDISNNGNKSKINEQCQCMSRVYLSQVNTQKDWFMKHIATMHSDLMFLKSFNAIETSPISFTENQNEFNLICQNLKKNQKALRLQTLLCLKKFEVLPQNYKDDSTMQVPCDIIDIMIKFEEMEAGFETEKAKILQIERIKAYIDADILPEGYVKMCYDFLIGCFWIKFTPLFPVVYKTISTLLDLKPDIIGQQILILFQNVGYLTQIFHSNDQLISFIHNNIDIEDQDDLIMNAFYENVRLIDDFMEFKDFLYNVSKCIQIQTVFENKKLRQLFFDQFFDFVNYEYYSIFSVNNNNKSTENTENILDLMTYPNMVDSEEYKSYRKIAYSKLYCYLEIIHKAESLTKIQHHIEFQQLLMRLLNTSDTKLQKVCLDCLIKSDQNGDLRQYRKLLEGFTEDEKFKDMIQVLIFGSQTNQSGNQNYTVVDEDNKGKEKGGNIPKLQQQHRLQVLPIVIKMLLSKLISKKGAINKKSIHTRRNIVFQFMATLTTDAELKLLFDEILYGFSIDISQDLNDKVLQNKLARVSFGGYLNFINQLSIIIKQMGKVLTYNNYLTKISKIVIQIMNLTKIFIKQLKLTFNENEDYNIEIDAKNSADVNMKDTLYRFVGHQSKVCLRKGLSIVKQMYTKYTYQPNFIEFFSEQVYAHILKDQLPLLNTNYTSDKSQVLEIMTVSWQNSINNYLLYPEIMPSIVGMLSQPKISSDVYELHLQLLKSLILKSIKGNEDKRDLAYIVEHRQIIDDDNEAMVDEQNDDQDKNTSIEVLTKYSRVIAENLFLFCNNNIKELKKSLISKKHYNKQRHAKVGQNKPDTSKQSLKDLIFIVSEISTYLPADSNELTSNFMDMIISVLSMRDLHKSSGFNKSSEELLHFGCKSVTNLISKLDSVTGEQLNKIFMLFLQIKSLRVRSAFSIGLQEALPTKTMAIDQKVLKILINLNTLKRGVADLEFDYDLIISTIQKLCEQDLNAYSKLEIQAITYNVLFLVNSLEFSVRDFASHFLKLLLEQAKNNSELHDLIDTLEQYIISLIKGTSDELVLKTVLEVIRQLIGYNKEIKSKSQLLHLYPLINLKDENEDFFSLFLSIKLKSRQRSLKLIASKMKDIELNYKLSQFIIMPLLNFVIFGAQMQKHNRRNTITYSREEKRATIDEALNVYKSVAQQLKWSDYYKLIKELLYKLSKVKPSTEEEDTKKYEKTVLKCICKVLDGFHFEGIPDAVSLLSLDQTQDTQEIGDLQEAIDKVFKAEEEKDQDISYIEESDEDEEVKIQEENAEMTDQTGLIKDIQDKLFTKVLPILERHIIEPAEENDDSTLVRSFVVMTIIKLIRKLPKNTFENQLKKTISIVTSKGLRQKSIGAREKGRKAMLKLIVEIGPKLLHLVIQEMHDQLQRGGYQHHTFVYSAFYFLQQLHEKQILQPGDVTNQIIEMMSEKLMEELFNVHKDNQLEDQEKVKNKESKAKKAIPTFEIMGQYIDFKKSFFVLIAPVIKALESNANISKIQQCEELLNKLSSALLKNQTLQIDDFLVFVYSIIHRGISTALKVKINDEKQQRDYGARIKDVFVKTKREYKEMTYQIDVHWKKSSQMLNDKKSQEICGRVLGAFGLSCLKKALKDKIKIDETNNSEEFKAKLDPFVGVLIDAFKTYHNPIINTSLNVLGQIIHMGLPSFKENLKKFLNRLFKLFDQTSSAADSDFMNSLFRCTGELIRNYATFQDLTQPQVKILLTIIKQNMNSHQIQNNVLSCLRAIVYRKFISADVYDLIESVQEIMITSISKPTRSICAQIFISFILEYPLEQSRIQQHINHILKNLGYFDSESRMQLLEILYSLVEKFPRELVDQFGELMFFTLMLRSVNETNAKCREKVTSVLKKILLKASQSKAKSLFETVIQMDSQNEQKKLVIQQAKLLVLGLFIDNQLTMKSSDLQKIIDQCMLTVQDFSLKLIEEKDNKKANEPIESDDEIQNPEMKKFLSNIDLGDDKEEKNNMIIDFEDQKNTEEWSPLYHSLSNIMKLLNLKKFKEFIEFNNAIQNLLIIGLYHRVYHIRLLVQQILEKLFEIQNENKLNILTTLSLQDEQELVNFLFKLANIFKYQGINNELGSLLIKNTEYLLRTVFQNNKCKELFNLLRFCKKCSVMAKKIMLNISKAKERIEMVLRFFQGLFTVFEELSNGEKDNKYIREIIEPVLDLVYRVYTDEQYANTKAKELSYEIVEHISNNLEKAFFINAYNEVKATIHKKRIERKKQQKIMMATPEGAKFKDKKRTKKQLKKKEKKKAKLLHYELRKS